ncbi:MAG: imidazolonepropionase [Planctomycetota bacterium]
MTPLLIRDARVATMTETGVLEHADVLTRDGTIAAIGTDLDEDPGGANARVIEARGRIVMPGFVDCHTHACWAGSRLDEWQAKLAGASYLELLEAGGGIMSTVRAVREAPAVRLTEDLLARLDTALRHGTTTIEIKSGYGLDTQTELKMLDAIADAAERWAGTIVPTALLGHAIDPDQPNFIERTIRETLPAVSERYPGIAVDAYCERGAWSVADCVRLFEKAIELGHPVRVHADQFNSLGMIGEAVRLGARSVDHLEASTPEDLRVLAESGAFGVVLPCAGLHLDDRYADARALLDAGGRVAIATNRNTGSAPCPSMPMTIALACRKNGLAPSEAIDAATRAPAELLGFGDRGVIRVGARADLIVLDHTDERDLAFEFGSNPVRRVFVAGREVDTARA